MSAEWPWDVLRLDGPAEERDVKKAYATRLRALDRSDVDAIQALRQAFEQARKLASAGSDIDRYRRPKMVEIARQTPRRTKPETEHAKAPPADPVVKPERRPNEPVETAKLKQFDNAVEPKNIETAKLSDPAKPGNPQSQPQTKTLKRHVSEPPPITWPASNKHGTQWGSTDLARAIDEIETILPAFATLTKRERAALQAVFERVAHFDRASLTQFEMALARRLIAQQTKLDKALADSIDQAFHWISDVSTGKARLYRIKGGAQLLAELGAATVPKKRFQWLPIRISINRDPRDKNLPPLMVEEIASMSALVLAVIYGVWQTFHDAGEGGQLAWYWGIVLESVVGFLVIIIITLLLEAIWFVLYPLRVIGLEWLLNRLYQLVTTAAFRRRIAARKPNKRGLSLSLSIIIIFAGLIHDAFFFSGGGGAGPVS